MVSKEQSGKKRTREESSNLKPVKSQISRGSHWLDGLRKELIENNHEEKSSEEYIQDRDVSSEEDSSDYSIDSLKEDTNLGNISLKENSESDVSDSESEILELEEGEDPYLSDEYDENDMEDSDIVQDDIFKKLQEEQEDNGSDSDSDVVVFDIVDQKEENQKNAAILQFVDEQMGALTNSNVDWKNKKDKSIFDDVDYDDDSSEDEGNVNTVGNVPLEWYEEYQHIGYDQSGKKIQKSVKRDTLDELVKRVDEPNKLEVFDEYNDRWVQISKSDVTMILDIMKGRFPTGVNPYRHNPEFEYDSRFPMVNTMKSKKSFLGINIGDVKQIEKLRKKIQSGWIPLFRREWKKPETLYLMWGPDGRIIDQEGIKRTEKLRAPKERLPVHADSYNPSQEFVSEDRVIYKSLREIPQPKNYVTNRLQRCLDLYLCPRVRTKKKKIDNPEDLLPNLPDPSELRPFPEFQTLIYEGHRAYVRSISVNPTGTHFVSGDADGILKLWEISTGRCIRTWNFGEMHQENPSIKWIEWNPNAQLNLFMIAIDNYVYLIHSVESGTDKVNEVTEALFPQTEYEKEPEIEIFNDDDTLLEDGQSTQINKEKTNIGDDDEQDEEIIKSKSIKNRSKVLIMWKFFRQSTDKKYRDQGILMRIDHLMAVTQITWHSAGDYFATLSPDANNDGIIVHQLSRRHSMKPFKKRFEHKGQKVVRVLFHPTRHFFYMVLPRKVRIFNLISQKQKKILKRSVCKYISDVDIHPQGEHVVTGGLDRRLEFFEAEISKTPSHSLKYHKKAIRRVRFHKRYPLFATCSDDGLIHVFHCTVYDDWLKDPLIVPVKILKGHVIHNSLGVMDIAWHPTQPWILTAGADGSIRLWTS